MDGFDLNIQNYTIKELKGLLSLGDVYHSSDVNAKKENICKKVSTDDTITFDMKIKMNNFIESVSKILLNLIESSSSNYSLVKSGSANQNINDNTSFTDLKNIMQKLNHTHIDLLKLDIEGAEINVLNQMLNDNIFPKYLCIEFDLFLKKKDKNNDTRKLINRLLQNNYIILINDNMNITFTRNI